MRIYIVRGIILFLLVFSLPVAGQQQSVSGSELVQRLISAYNNFNYRECADLLNIAFQSIDKFSPRDQKQIYQYAAFIAFQNGNIVLAKNHFWQLLEIDPTYSPDPLTTSPKLLTLFRKTKIEFLEDLNRRLKQVQERGNQRDIPWRAFLFPGWEQWHRGNTRKGLVYSGVGAAFLSGTIYSIVMTHRKKTDYEKAIGSARIQSLYDEYNRYYKWQYYFGYAFVATYIFSQFDLILWNQPRVSLNTSAVLPSGNNAVLAIQLKLQF